MLLQKYFIINNEFSDHENRITVLESAGGGGDTIYSGRGSVNTNNWQMTASFGRTIRTGIIICNGAFSQGQYETTTYFYGEAQVISNQSSITTYVYRAYLSYYMNSSYGYCVWIGAGA